MGENLLDLNGISVTNAMTFTSAGGKVNIESGTVMYSSRTITDTELKAQNIVLPAGKYTFSAEFESGSIKNITTGEFYDPVFVIAIGENEIVCEAGNAVTFQAQDGDTVTSLICRIVNDTSSRLRLMVGDAVFNITLAGASEAPSGLPDRPVLRAERFLAKMAGQNISLPEPVTRVEKYLAKLAGQDVDLPEPITRTEQYLAYIINHGS